MHSLSEGRLECGVSESVGYFFWWVWPRVHLGLASVAPALLLIALVSIVFVHSLRLHLRHRHMLNSLSTVGIEPSFCAVTAPVSASNINSDHQQQHQQAMHPDARRLADARRECVELAHLLPTAIAVALTRVLHLSFLLFYTNDPFSAAISGPASPTSHFEQSEGLSSAALARTRHLSLALLGTQIVFLSAHAAALPLVALIFRHL